MNPIDAVFQRLRAEKRKAFIPFLTAGDPDLEHTQLMVHSVAAAGADIIEIGFPYSDPIADGPVIQASYTRALARGIRTDDIFAALARLSADPSLRAKAIPLVGMVSFALVYRRGLDRFLADAKDAGLSGAIIPDLPAEEAENLAGLAQRRDFKLIQLITPTTPRDRAIRIARLSSGFIYYVSVTGITGERDRLPEELTEQLRWLRGQTELPICVGFGISKPEHILLLRDFVDGVIVGSALVRRFEEIGAKPAKQVANEVAAIVRSLSEALNGERI
jgi:tryptophan synthase alpha chain